MSAPFDFSLLSRQEPPLRPATARRRTGGGSVARALALGCAVFAQAAFGAGETNRTPDRVVSRFRLGPFFEYRATRDGGTFWALRPFYSKLNDPVSDTQVCDVAWPIGTYHRDREQSWWRFALAYGSDNDIARDDAAWKAALFPLYFQGRSRQGEDYWALFPLYGHLPHMLFMDDIDFTLFPLYLNYEINRVERDYYVWPVFSVMGPDPRASRVGVFPLYGRTRRKESEHLYAFWPFWTSAVYDGSKNKGSSWMLFPVAGQVDREKEKQGLLLPPFFSHAVTDSAERWRVPWPFVVLEDSKDRRSRSFWPLYGTLESDDERKWYAAWPLIEHFSLKAGDTRTERSRFFPFYVGETVYEKEKDGVERKQESFTRFWPFFSREANKDRSRLRVLELNLIRSSGPIERNWSPFWTVYERVGQGSEVTHDALWGLLRRRTAVEPGFSEESKP